MGNPKIGSQRRTRMQNAAFYREFNEEKKKKKREESETGGSEVGARAEGGGSGSSGGLKLESLADSDSGFSLGGPNFVGFRKGKKKVGELEKGLVKTNQNLVPIGFDSKKMGRSFKKGVKLRENKNVGVVIVDEDDEDESEDEVEDFSKVTVQKKKRILGRLKSFKKGVEMGIGDVSDESDDDDDEIQFISMEYKGVNVVVEDCLGDSNTGSNEVFNFKDSQKRDECDSVKVNGVLEKVEEILCLSSDSTELIESESTESDSTESSHSGDLESTGKEHNDHPSDDECEVDDSSSTCSEDSSSSESDESVDGKEKENVGGKGKETMAEEVELKRRRGRPRKDANLGNSSSCSVDSEGKEGDGFMRKHYSGLDILIDCNREDGGEESNDPKSVADRVLRRRVSKSTKSKKTQQLGTFSSPFTLTDDELDSSSKEEDDNAGDARTSSQDCNGGKAEKGKGKVGRPAKRMHDGVDFDSPISVDKILADSTGEKGAELLEILVSSSLDEDGTSNDEGIGFENHNDGKYAGQAGEKGRRKVGRPAKKRCYGFDSAFPISVDKILADSILEGDVPLENSVSTSGHEDGTDDDEGDGLKNFDDGKYAQTTGEKGNEGKGKAGRPAKKRRRAAISVDKILADSIWGNGDESLEKLVNSGDKVSDQEATLPLKFTFKVEDDPKPPEKSYWDIEAEKLFAELDFVLAACEIGSSDSSKVNKEDSVTPETESDPAPCCCQGKHRLVLDEQIGLICSFCHSVELEIKHFVPTFGKHPWGRSDKTYVSLTDRFNLDELQFPDSASAYHAGCNYNFQAEGTVWDIIPGIKYSMYPHQREGFEFIWKNIAGGIDLEELSNNAFDGGSGCIISHAPGTGKTRLTLVFLQTYMALYQTCRPVIIAPRNMLLTWEEEFRKWNVDIPFHNLNNQEFSGQENKTAVSLLRKVGGQDINSIRMVKLYSWKKDRSILGISYTLFEKLVGGGVFVNQGGKKKRGAKCYAEHEKVRKMLLELPGLLVLDEGHTPRNDRSLIWQALSGVETQRRIILSGTPFQNNFDELFNTLRLVRPKFADRFKCETRGDSGHKRGRKRSAGKDKWASFTSSINIDSDAKLHKLKAMIDPFVHVHKGTILQENLPGLRDCMVVLYPTHLQKALIRIIQSWKHSFELDHFVSLVSIHPTLLLDCCAPEVEKLAVYNYMLERLRFEHEAGVKTQFLMELIRLSKALKERVLVFSQYIDPLVFIREQLKHHFGWTEGKEVLYMDGQLDPKHRQSSISLLNDPASEVQVLLASTRACCEGINLVGASRVVLLDVVWNPSLERQAISRAYRLGQKKIVYIYHLIASTTRESEKYQRQVEKDRLSELVFSSADGGVHKPKISCTVTEDKILEEIVQHEKISKIFEKILYQPKESNLIDTFG